MELSLDDVRARPRRTMPVTMECAGNGRARLSPRPVSQPWLVEAVGTAEWTGTPLGPLLEEAGLAADAVEVVFSGADRGMQGDIEQDYQRSLSVADAMRPEVLLAYEMNGRPLEPQHGFPLRLLVPGWYGMTSVKWLAAIEAVAEPFTGYQQTPSYLYQQDAEDPGEPVTRIRVRALMAPARHPRLLHPAPPRGARARCRSRAAPGRAGAVERVEVGVDGAWSDARLEPAVGEFAWRGWSWRLACDAGRARAVLPRDRRERRRPAARSAVELPGHGQQPRAPGAGDRSLSGAVVRPS